jgi:hydroxymethylpyrimidine pyrophosphatase-like HAD family hydrolase
MLVAAAGAFVPENSAPEALAAATYIVRSNNDHAVAHVIEILDKLYK